MTTHKQLIVSGLKAAVLATTVFATTASASEIRLVAHDGSLDVQGDFIAYEDGFYTVLTTLGALHLDGYVFNCMGDDCAPDTTSN